MKRKWQVLVFALVFVIGTLVGRVFIAPFLSKEVIGVVLMATGAISSIAPSFLASVVGKLDQMPPKEMSRHYASRIWRKMAIRRRVFWTRYFIALSASVVSICVGGLLKFQSTVGESWTTAVGLGAGVVGISVAVLAIHEYQQVTSALRGVAEYMEALRRKNEFLDRK